ncbi:MAG TPA: 6,7-dimethyl-8-ribityllumazine synthase [Patescibacteria group bacterium]
MRRNVFEKKISGRGFKFALIIARFNPPITDGLKNGALKALKANQVDEDDIDIYEVPGAFELPLIAQKTAVSKDHDAIICLGAVTKGETPHFHYVAKAVTDGVVRVNLDTGKPVLFGVLTTDDISQAEARSADDDYNKGREAALAALEMVNLIKSENL